MANELDLNEYERMMSEWFDELAPMVNAFKRQFPPHSVGSLRYLFALHMMQAAACLDLEVPLEEFTDFVRRITADWLVEGRPESFAVYRGRIITDRRKPN